MRPPKSWTLSLRLNGVVFNDMSGEFAKTLEGLASTARTCRSLAVRYLEMFCSDRTCTCGAAVWLFLHLYGHGTTVRNRRSFCTTQAHGRTHMKKMLVATVAVTAGALFVACPPAFAQAPTTGTPQV